MEIVIGTYINDNSETIFKLKFDLNLNIDEKIVIDLNSLKGIKAGPNPSCIYITPDLKTIYAVNELNIISDHKYGSVVCLQNEQFEYTIKSLFSTEGNYPCHIVLDSKNQFLIITNYGSGTICVYKLNIDGVITHLVQKIENIGKSINIERQEMSHPHQSLFSPSENFLFVTDLGCDCIYCYSIFADSIPLKLNYKIQTPKGYGPRHMAFSLDYSMLFVSCELSSSILQYQYNKHDDSLNFIDNYFVFPDELQPYPRTSISEIVFCNNYVLVANRGDDSISIFKYEDKQLCFFKKISSGGICPRHFVCEFIGNCYLIIIANQNSNAIVFVILNSQLEITFTKEFHIKSPSWIQIIKD